jgi:hypothetical protein
VQPATSKSRATLNIFLPPGPDEIYHHLPRLFAVYATEYALAGDPVLNDWLNTQLPQLTVAYLKDVAAGPFDLKAATSEFAPKADIAGLKAALQGSKAPTFDAVATLLGLSSDQSLAIGSTNRRIQSFIFSHAFDSYYCNSWAQANSADLQQIKSGKKSVSAIGTVYNTREIMRTLFPQTFEIFSQKIASRIENIPAVQVKKIYSAPAQQSASSAGAFSLDSANPYATTSFWFKDAPSAFFGSIWDNTGGAVGRGYQSYSESVQRAVDRNYSGGNIVVESGKALAGGLQDAYVENVYKPIQEKNEQRFDTQINGGASVNQATFNSVNLAVGDVLGTTPLVEGTAGIDTASARNLNGMERVERIAHGTAALAGNAALVAGFTPYAGRVVAGGAEAAGAGVLPSAAEIEANTQVARSIGVPEKYATGVGSAFEAGAEVQTLKKGDIIYRQYGGTSKPASYWYSTEPYTNPIQDLALRAENPANKVAAFRVTQDTQVLAGGLAPQNGVSGIATNAYGGGSQIYMPEFQSSLQRINPWLGEGVVGGAAGQTPNTSPADGSGSDYDD